MKMEKVYLALKLVGVALTAAKLFKEYKDGTLDISADGLKDVVDMVTKPTK